MTGEASTAITVPCAVSPSSNGRDLLADERGRIDRRRRIAKLRRLGEDRGVRRGARAIGNGGLERVGELRLEGHHGRVDILLADPWELLVDPAGRRVGVPDLGQRAGPRRAARP